MAALVYARQPYCKMNIPLVFLSFSLAIFYFQQQIRQTSQSKPLGESQETIDFPMNEIPQFTALHAETVHAEDGHLTRMSSVLLRKLGWANNLLLLKTPIVVFPQLTFPLTWTLLQDTVRGNVSFDFTTEWGTHLQHIAHVNVETKNLVVTPNDLPLNAVAYIQASQENKVLGRIGVTVGGISLSSPFFKQCYNPGFNMPLSYLIHGHGHLIDPMAIISSTHANYTIPLSLHGPGHWELPWTIPRLDHSLRVCAHVEPSLNLTCSPSVDFCVKDTKVDSLLVTSPSMHAKWPRFSKQVVAFYSHSLSTLVSWNAQLYCLDKSLDCFHGKVLALDRASVNPTFSWTVDEPTGVYFLRVYGKTNAGNVISNTSHLFWVTQGQLDPPDAQEASYIDIQATPWKRGVADTLRFAIQNTILEHIVVELHNVALFPNTFFSNISFLDGYHSGSTIVEWTPDVSLDPGQYLLRIHGRVANLFPSTRSVIQAVGPTFSIGTRTKPSPDWKNHLDVQQSHQKALFQRFISYFGV